MRKKILGLIAIINLLNAIFILMAMVKTFNLTLLSALFVNIISCIAFFAIEDALETLEKKVKYIERYTEPQKKEFEKIVESIKLTEEDLDRD